MHGDLKIEQDWLKVEKKFNDKYLKSEELKRMVVQKSNSDSEQVA